MLSEIIFLEKVLSMIEPTNYSNHLGSSFFGSGKSLPYFSVKNPARLTNDFATLK
tara:strand:- start:250 stop:414 length:165 start_codon:yes stop_codon:yes gene_type:complete